MNPWENRVAVDWDGTCVEQAWPKMGEWLPGAREGMAALLEAGLDVVINSTRLAAWEIDEETPRVTEEHWAEVQHVRSMLDEAGLFNVDIWLKPWKVGARWYVDDKAGFDGDWPALVKFLIHGDERTETPSERAFNLVRGARQSDYGHPLDNHLRIADFWTVRLRDKLKPGEQIEAHEAAAMMRLLKEARLMHTPGHEDSLDDLAGYTDVEFEIHRERRRRELS